MIGSILIAFVVTVFPAEPKCPPCDEVRAAYAKLTVTELYGLDGDANTECIARIVKCKQECDRKEKQKRK